MAAPLPVPGDLPTPAEMAQLRALSTAVMNLWNFLDKTTPDVNSFKTSSCGGEYTRAANAMDDYWIGSNPRGSNYIGCLNAATWLVASAGDSLKSDPTGVQAEGPTEEAAYCLQSFVNLMHELTGM